MASSSLANRLEVWGFEEDALIYKDCSLGAVLKLTARDGTCATDQEMNLLHDSVCDFLNGFPAGVNLQFLQITERGGANLLQAHREGGSKAESPLAKRLLEDRVERLAKLDEMGQIPKPVLYLTIRRKFVRSTPEKKSILKTCAAFFEYGHASSENWSRSVLEPELQLFRQLVKSIQSGLESLGVRSVQLSRDAVYALLFDQWNPAHALGPGQFNEEDFRDELLLSDLVVSLDGFALGRVHHRVISLKIMPDQTFASMSEKLRQLPFDSKLALTIETLNQGRETLALETQRRIAYALYAGKKGVADLPNQAKLQDIEKLLAKRVSGEEKVFSVAFSVILRAESEETLSDQVEAVLQAMRELSGAEGMVESLASAQIFMEQVLPNARAKERTRRMNTSVLADFLPILGEWEGHANPRVLLRSRSGGLLGFDPFSPELTNFNQLVSGGSGAGKSFMTNLMTAQLMAEDPQVYILDIGGSYRQMTEHLGGQYVALGADSQIALNPFDLSDSGEEALDQKIKFLVSLTEIMTKEEQTAGIGKLERSEIEQSVREILAQEPEPRLSNLRARLLANSDPLLQRMGKILGPWCGDSPYGKFVDRKTTLSLDRRIVCFDLKGLEGHPDLQAACLFIITDLIWREIQRDRTSMKLVVFDECWRLLENEAGASFIGEVFRTFRKYRASAVGISQTMDDFARSKVAQAILPNASIRWVLKQTGGNLPSLQSTLQLNEREMQLVESVTSKKGFYSEAFLIAGDRKSVVAIESTSLEYWLATTDPLDLQALKQEQEHLAGVTGLPLLERMARKFPRGASVPVAS